MRKRIAAMILGVFLLNSALVGCGTSTTNPVSNVENLQKEAPIDASVDELSDESGKLQEEGFAIHFPNEPEYTSEAVPSPLGDIAFHIYMLEEDDIVYMLGFNEYPEEFMSSIADKEALFQGAIEGASSGAQVAVVEQKDISLGQHEGKQVKYEGSYDGENVTIYQQVFLVENRMYQLNVTTASENDFHEDIQSFFNSFEIIENK